MPESNIGDLQGTKRLGHTK